MDEEQQQRQVRRHSRTGEEAERLAVEFEASGLTRQEFSSQRGVPMKTLARYVARYRKKKADKNPRQRWVAVEVAEERGHGDELSVVLDNGRRIAVQHDFDAGTLRRLLTVLERV
ncbi:MAG: hypothetical protein HUU41_01800 [Bryobacteraceae bacterium]|nr:hypothetical protein [Bryobacterales bacterium]NUM99823.1 hypothetical protein [Bryobacteraceae bacterium]